MVTNSFMQTDTPTDSLTPGQSNPKEMKSTDAGSTWFQMVQLEQPEPEYIERPPVPTDTKSIQTEPINEPEPSFLQSFTSFFSNN